MTTFLALGAIFAAYYLVVNLVVSALAARDQTDRRFDN
jgi:hypothetical protein